MHELVDVIEFRPLPGAEGRLEQLRANGQQQVIVNDHDKPYAHLKPVLQKKLCGPSDKPGLALLEFTSTAQHAGPWELHEHHQMHLQAILRVLADLNGHAVVI